MDAADRLLWAMKHAGRTNKAQLAREARVKEVTLRSYFLGHAHPPLEVCERIGERLGVNGRWLFDETGDRLAVETQPFVSTPLLPQDSRITLPVYGMAIGGDDGRFETVVPARGAKAFALFDSVELARERQVGYESIQRRFE